MTRYSHYDTDEERLPEGMTRVGYDADTQVYTFQDTDGSYWESAPGCEYGQLTRVGDDDFNDADQDRQPFLAAHPAGSSMSWRTDMMPLLNFGVILGFALLLFFWYLRRAAPVDEDDPPTLSCAEDLKVYTIRGGDTCWALGETHGITVDEILADNQGLDCDKLTVGSQICLPDV